jgi:2'-5' RNA ligase
VANAVADFDPFVLTACGAGAFPSLDRPRTLWIGVTDGRDEMIDVQSAVETALLDLGFHAEKRPYMPHLTLGRAGRGRNPHALADALRQFADYDAGGGLVDEVIVYGSEPSRDGPTYHVIGRAALGG